jgi:hypothetical protein
VGEGKWEDYKDCLLQQQSLSIVPDFKDLQELQVQDGMEGFEQF